MIKIKRFIFLTLLVFYQTGTAQTNQLQRSGIQDPQQQGWVGELNFGIDLLSNLLINPTVGGGTNRLGFGASFEAITHFNSGRFSWQNNLNLQYGIQKSGSGFSEEYPDKKVPFQKNMDNIWLSSKAALRTSYFSKFYYTTDLFFSSQMTPTYQDNFLSDVTGTGQAVSKFLAPGLLQLAAGIDYRHNAFLSVFVSPLSYRAIIVNDEKIADDIAQDEEGNILGTIHGNPLEINEDNSLSIKKYDNQLGAAVRFVYDNQITERFGISSNLMLFSNYKRDPDHIDINWRNSIDLTIFKGFKLSLLSLLTYDHDVLVQITDNDRPGGISGFGRRVSYTQQLAFRYSFSLE